MKKLLFLLTLFGCAHNSLPIEYSVHPDYNDYVVAVSGDDMDTIRNRAFIIATDTCGYQGKNWKMISIAASKSQYGARVELRFTCQ